MAFIKPVVEHWLEWETAQKVHPSQYKWMLYNGIENENAATQWVTFIITKLKRIFIYIV